MHARTVQAIHASTLIFATSNKTHFIIPTRIFITSIKQTTTITQLHCLEHGTTHLPCSQQKDSQKRADQKTSSKGEYVYISGWLWLWYGQIWCSRFHGRGCCDGFASHKAPASLRLVVIICWNIKSYIHLTPHYHTISHSLTSWTSCSWATPRPAAPPSPKSSSRKWSPNRLNC